MHDIMDAVVRLKTKFPFGYTAEANGDLLDQEEADQLLKRDAEQVLYLLRETPRLMREALAGLGHSQADRKFLCESLQPPLSIFELGETQVTPVASASCDLGNGSKLSNVSSGAGLTSEQGVCLGKSAQTDQS